MRSTAVVLFLVVLVFAASLSAYDIDSLLINSVGGPQAYDSILALTSVFYRGAATISGLDGELRVWVFPPNKYLLEFKSAGFSITRGFDGRSAWERDQNGRVHELSGFERELIEKSAYFESFSHLIPRRMKGTRRYNGVHLRGDHTYHVVQCVPSEGDTSWLYLDVLSGLCDVIETRLNDELVTSSMTDYRSVSGILVPFLVRDTISDLPVSSVVALHQADINLAVDPVIFDKPKSNQKDYHFPADITRITMPFSFVDSHIFVRATLNGKVAVYLLLDSGSSGNIYYRPAIETLDLPIIGYLPVLGVAANDSIGLVALDSVRVGELVLFDQVVGTMAKSPIGQVSLENAEFGGILGFDFISRFPILIDYEKNELTVFDPDQFVLPAGGVEIPFRFETKVPTISAEIAGITGDFLLDLGNAIGLILHADFVRRNDLESRLENIHELSGAMLGVGGATAMRGATAPSFAFGGVKLGATPVFLPESAGGISSSRRIDGNIGNPVLAQFTVLLDYPKNRIVLYSPTDKKTTGN